jgi:hypothetical protein
MLIEPEVLLVLLVVGQINLLEQPLDYVNRQNLYVVHLRPVGLSPKAKAQKLLGPGQGLLGRNEKHVMLGPPEIVLDEGIEANEPTYLGRPAP